MKNELEIFLEQFDKLTLDSRQISKNTVFIAYPGMKFDGRDFIEQAVNNGANGIVFESENYKKKFFKVNKIIPVGYPRTDKMIKYKSKGNFILILGSLGDRNYCNHKNEIIINWAEQIFFINQIIH